MKKIALHPANLATCETTIVPKMYTYTAPSFGNKRRILNIHSCWSQFKKKRATKLARLSYRRFE